MFQDFARVGRWLVQDGLVPSLGGTISCRDGDKLLITKNDAPLADLQGEELLTVPLAAAQDKTLEPRDAAVHRAIYRETGAAAVVQVFSPQTLAVSLTDNKIIPQDSEGQAVIKSAAIVRIHQPLNPEETVRLLPAFLQGSSVAAVVRGYSVFAIGSNLTEAYRHAALLERSCQILVSMRASGGNRPPAPKDKPLQSHQPRHDRRSAIPPGIGVMDRSRYKR